MDGGFRPCAGYMNKNKGFTRARAKGGNPAAHAKEREK